MCIRDRIEIKSEINANNIELKTEIIKQDKKLKEIDNKLEEQNKTIAGVKDELTVDINKIMIDNDLNGHQVYNLSLIQI